ncbi:hypothetical protein AB6813_18410 [bacterium RCC_150]
MTSSGNRRRTWAVSLLAAGLLLTACQGTPTPAASTQAGPPESPKTDVTASPGTTARDGRIIESAGSQACANPALDDIRQKLGTVAAQIQAAVPSATEAQGVKETDCTYSLAAVPQGQDPDAGNALTISKSSYPDAASLAKVELPRLMISPKAIDEAGDRAWYARNQLSSSTEYVLESVSNAVITRITLAVPVQAPAIEDPEAKLTALLRAS